MKTLNFWKSLLVAGMAVAAFTACSDDNTGGGGDVPADNAYIHVNGSGTATLNVEAAGGTTEAVTVEVGDASIKWTMTVPTDANWIHPSVTTGSSLSLTFDVDALPDNMPDGRQANVTLTANVSVAGTTLPISSTITIKQGVAAAATNVAEIRAMIASMATESGVEITDDVTLTGIAITDMAAGGLSGNKNMILVDNTTDPGASIMVRLNNAYSPDPAIGQVFSGSIKGAKAVLYQGRDLQLDISAGGSLTPVDGQIETVTPIEVSSLADLPQYVNQLVKMSNIQPAETAFGGMFYDTTIPDGETKSETYTTTPFVTTTGSSVNISIYYQNAGWAGTLAVPEKSGSITGIVALFNNVAEIHPRNAADIQLDQPTFTIGTTEGSIGDILAAGEVASATVSGTVVATCASGFMIADETGAIQVYTGAAPAVAINDEITATGSTKMYQGVLEFATAKDDANAVQVTGTGSYTLPEPEVMDGAAVDAYIATATANTAVYKYVQYNGQFVVSGNYFDVVIDGTSTQGGVASDDRWASFNGVPVTVTGWLMGGTASFMQTMATSISAGTDPYLNVTPTSLSFVAAGDTQTATINSGNLTDDITTAITGDGADQFSATIDGNTVSVVAIANTDAAAKTATLTLTSGSLSATIALSQAGTVNPYASMTPFVALVDNSTDASYTMYGKTSSTADMTKPSMANGQVADGFKLGTASKGGTFTSQAVGVSGDLTLGFYGEGWNKEGCTVTITVNNGGTIAQSTFECAANAGCAGSIPFPDLTPADTDYYTTTITGLTPESTITFTSEGRGAFFGVTLF